LAPWIITENAVVKQLKNANFFGQGFPGFYSGLIRAWFGFAFCWHLPSKDSLFAWLN